MAAMMGGTMRSPLTGILFAVELTGDLALLGPLLAATGAAYAVTVLLLKRSILTEKIARRGQRVVREYSVDPFELQRVSEVMVREVDTLPADMTVDQAIAFFSADEHRHKSYPIQSRDGSVIGMVTRADILRWRTEPDVHAETPFDRHSDDSPIIGHAAETVARLADRMAAEDVGRVPIVERSTMQLVGLVSRKDLLRIRCDALAAEETRQSYFGKTLAAEDEAGRRRSRQRRGLSGSRPFADPSVGQVISHSASGAAQRAPCRCCRHHRKICRRRRTPGPIRRCRAACRDAPALRRFSDRCGARRSRRLPRCRARARRRPK
jgi:chloride channel protein, CIC family